MPDITKKTFIWVIVGLIVLRIILMILVMNNVPFTNMRDGGFRPTFTESYQPDEPEFFELSKNLAKGQTAKLAPNIGAPLVFAPLIYFNGIDSLDKFAPIAFIFQAFILFSLAIILVALIGYYLFNFRTLALASAFLFVIYPWLLFGIFKLIGYDNAIPAFHYQLWIFILSDYLSAFWVYLSFFLIFKWFKDIFESSVMNWGKLIILSVASGAAILTRIGNFWLILIILAAFLYSWKLKKAINYGFFLGLAYLPQLIFNTVALGAPWVFGYRDPSVGASTSSTPLAEWFNPENLWFNFAKFSPQYYFLLFLVIAAFFIFIFFFGYKYFSKTNKKFAVIAAAWFLSYLIFYGLFDESLSQLRYFLPAVPVFSYFFIASIIYIKQKLYLKKQYV